MKEHNVDINSISSGAISANMQQKVGDTVGIKVANKALDIQATNAAQLISSVAKPVATESHLGNNVNTHA